MFEAIALFLIAASYTAGYFVSLYSMAVYVDPDDLSELAPDVSNGTRHFLETLAKNPRASLQVATVFKSFQLVLVSVMSGLLLEQISARSELTVFVAFPVGFAVVWLLQILFVEFLPRRHARRAVNPNMLRHLWLIRLVHWLFLPIVGGYRRILRNNADVPVSEEDKEDIIERAIETLADQAGIDERIVEDEEKEMIGQIFQLDQTVVREIMIPRIKVTGIERHMSFRDIQQLVVQDGHSRFPVYEESIDRVIGILYVKDLFNNMPGPGEEFVIARYLRKPFFVPESKVIGELLREFKARKQHIALVVDEYGGLAGLVTLEDILEEIVGDIQDEHDPDETQLLVRTDDGYLVDASMLVSDLQEVLDTEYEQGDYDTVGGLMYHLFGEVPRQGQRIRWHDLTFEIVSVDAHRIRQVRIRQRAGARINGFEDEL
ncbi:MAG: hemolysin family protein [candidate division Zixibacteria bacterium]|jgi:CBS domain containing-hemolysin-like protein|nr:hemolysin family protein [candidate division Zixibacteria bacterium]